MVSNKTSPTAWQGKNGSHSSVLTCPITAGLNSTSRSRGVFPSPAVATAIPEGFPSRSRLPSRIPAWSVLKETMREAHGPHTSQTQNLSVIRAAGPGASERLSGPAPSGAVIGIRRSDPSAMPDAGVRRCSGLFGLWRGGMANSLFSYVMRHWLLPDPHPLSWSRERLCVDLTGNQW